MRGENLLYYQSNDLIVYWDDYHLWMEHSFERKGTGKHLTWQVMSKILWMNPFPFCFT